MKDYEFHVDAEVEYVRAGEFYAESDNEIGRRFFAEIERLITDIRRDPLRFRIYDGPVRRHFSDTFPYAVLYLVHADKIVIVSVMHMKREPGYWRSRVK